MDVEVKNELPKTLKKIVVNYLDKGSIKTARFNNSPGFAFQQYKFGDPNSSDSVDIPFMTVWAEDGSTFSLKEEFLHSFTIEDVS